MVDFLSPSQLISVLLIAGGLAVAAVELYVDQKKKKAAEAVLPEEADAAPQPPAEEPEIEA